jgi:hypothetical protein
VSYKETINCERYVQVILEQLSPHLTEEERLWLVSAKLSYCLYACLCTLYPMSSGTELSPVISGQRVHLILNLVSFSSGVV